MLIQIKEEYYGKDMLLHQARFQPWMPFYQETLDATKHPDSAYYRKVYSPEFPHQVAENLYLREDYPGIIISKIAQSKLLPKLNINTVTFHLSCLRNIWKQKPVNRLTGLLMTHSINH
ncbi:hypothetical protein LRS05_16525 [Flavobacterium sp. J372]|uniref:hypothetical protein n=1 Tax=Flavobacterium sp. J372 TaxID=2898436 RepID=UPI002150D532|nr:hypothetical protein [Flavobacterium sp. J372]MCR5863608.1 hypothetical protein [Flavobacterium sp. J372]